VGFKTRQLRTSEGGGDAALGERDPSTQRRKDKAKAKDDEKQEKRRLKEEERARREREKEKERERKRNSKSKEGQSGGGGKTGKGEKAVPTLEDLVLAEGRPIPLFLEKCVRFIEQEGLDSEGIYRVPGNRAHVDILFQKLEEGCQFKIKIYFIMANFSINCTLF
jgi:hypothetical protein